MALSKSIAQNTAPELPLIAQHYLPCDTENCKKNCQFYCNDCHRSLCEQCRDEHQKGPDTKHHKVVPYRQRKIQLPVEKCKDHPNKDTDMLCEYCQVPVCSKCATQDHQNHTLKDLETIYSEKFTLCLEKIHKIHQFYIPNSKDMLKDIKKNATDIKEIMENIRSSVKNETESLKCLMETVMTEKIEQVNKMEESLMEQLQSQDNTYKDYISYLEDLAKVFHGYLSSTKVQNNPIILSLSDRLKIKPIPETTKPVPPEFTAGQYSKEDVTKLLGKVTVPDIKPENREIKPMETASTQYHTHGFSVCLFGFLLLFVSYMHDFSVVEHIGKQIKQSSDKSDVKPTLSMSSSVTKVREYTVPGVDSVYHISIGKWGTVWGSDIKGNLVQTDLQEGKQLHMIQTSFANGYHTVTEDGDLIYTDRNHKVINRIALDKTVTEFIKTGDWEPISIHSSRINGDILVGMITNREAKFHFIGDILVGMRKNGDGKVTRYTTSGKEIQNIQRDNKGQGLYSYPYYITENINGDICTSDFYKQAVVVVNKSGQHRFSYTGQGSEFRPFGICTDLLGHILVSDVISDTVHLLNQDGQFLSVLLTLQQLINRPVSVCVDDENNLHVGQDSTNTVTVHKYLP
ncbi:uncharacterized protein LOC128168307 [Crassostrea angulata]|uniref:uncharacterized protein LOC128168307 n=1 Tax=Magallana angulata TaxID=2784310 RepID=UPI0022B1EE40|nr:uncharacterized protein LOC128168307 [Crassostrea angulata]